MTNLRCFILVAGLAGALPASADTPKSDVPLAATVLGAAPEPALRESGSAHLYRSFLQHRYGSSTHRDVTGYYWRGMFYFAIPAVLSLGLSVALALVAHQSGSRGMLNVSYGAAGVGGFLGIGAGILGTYLGLRDNSLPPWHPREVEP